VVMCVRQWILSPRTIY